MATAKADIFKKALSRNVADTNLTRDEAGRLEESMENEQFQQLFMEYVDEISNPKHRAENEVYLKQLEEQNDCPEGKQVLHPEKGFVLRFKFTRKGHSSKNSRKSAKKQGNNKPSKLFLNIVHSDKIDKPTSIDATGGKLWSLPYSLSPIRMEHEHVTGKNLVPTLDCCFHPLALAHCNNSAFRNLIAKTAREAAAVQYTNMKDPIEIDPNFTLVSGIQYKNGEPAIMVIAAPTAVPGPAQRQTELDDASGKGLNGKETINATLNQSEVKPKFLKKGFLLEGAKTASTTPSVQAKGEDNGSLLNATQTTRFDPSSKNDADEELKVIPHYEVVEKGNFDMADHTMDVRNRPSTRPSFLEYRVSLPNIKSAKCVDLDVSEGSLVLTSTKYHLCVKLPYPIMSDHGTAKFDKSRSTLNVVLPVVQRHEPTAPSVSVPVGNESKEDLINSDEEDSKDIVPVDSTVVVNKEQDEHCHSRWVDVNATTAKSHEKPNAIVESVPVLLPTSVDETRIEHKEEKMKKGKTVDSMEDDYIMIEKPNPSSHSSEKDEVDDSGFFSDTHFKSTMMFDLD